VFVEDYCFYSPEKHKEEITRHAHAASEAQRHRDRENEEKDLQRRKEGIIKCCI